MPLERSAPARFGVLFVCSGNICRSPTAEGVFRQFALDAGIESMLDIDSAGTERFHVGEPPDPRAQAHARLRGYELKAIRARSLEPGDYRRFDWLLAMDKGHLGYMKRRSPPEEIHRLRLFLEFDRQAPTDEVPDPYYGGGKGFEEVLDLIESASRELVLAVLAEIQRRGG